MSEFTEAHIVSDLAVVAAGVRVAGPGGAPFVPLPDNYRVHDLARTLPTPPRPTGKTEVHDAESFAALVLMHRSPNTMVFRSVDPPQFSAVFNANTEAGPGWGDHGVVYNCPLSPEWRTWIAANKRSMPQAEFAQFIEDNLPDIAGQDGGLMLEVSRTLQAKRKVNFASAIRLDNGQHQFTYEETTAGSAGARGQLAVPEVFTLGLRVFIGGPAYAVPARLRYRIADGGALAMWFDLLRPHKVLEDAAEQLRLEIEGKLGMPMIHGAPKA